jgi:glycyl-tRNA synthetase beta chain
MSELILELYTEEIPALMQQNAQKAYESIFTKKFAEQEITFQALEVHIGPRRLALHVSGLPLKSMVKHVELKGPKADAPSQAVLGFCKTNNISQENLQIESINNINYYVYKSILPETELVQILPTLLTTSLAEYIWPKSMCWSNYGIKYVRPLLNIMCIFNGETLEFSYAHLKSNNQSFGHRFIGYTKFTVTSWKQYLDSLANSHVILESTERHQIITQGIRKITAEKQLLAPIDPKLLEEVVGLVEFPVVLCGTIPERFMNVPKEILILAMKTHQKYFYTTFEDGSFAPYFIFVSNLPNASDDVIQGNERVLSARLSDAAYFFIQDQKTSLESRLDKLKSVVFHAKLGSIYDKSLRLIKIANHLDPKNSDLVNAARICKADLVTEAVVEFPELQGIMGSYYSELEGSTKNTVQAIRNHYLPLGNNDDIPTSTAASLALIDKMDSLVSLMFAGERATGSKDPYALRRYAIGIIKIILENNMHNFNITNLIDYNLNLHTSDTTIRSDIISFIEDRIKGYFKERYEHKLINAVVDLSIDDNLCSIEKKLLVLNSFVTTTKGQNLIQLYSRVANIIKDASNLDSVDPTKFITASEKDLYNALMHATPLIEKGLNSKDYNAIFTYLTNLEEPIATFFDAVLVNDSDISIANNRKSLLESIASVFTKVAKFEYL